MPQFQTLLFQPEGRPVTGIIVPPEVIDALGGGKKPLVKVTLNNHYTYRSAVAVMNGKFMISVSAEHRDATGLKGGDPIDVDLALDTEPRVTEVPEDFAAALDQSGLRTAFDKLAPSHRKEHVRAIEEAKTADTRQRRIDKAVALIASKASV